MAERANRPNILYLHAHDTGRFIAPYGYPAPTPQLQHLANEGMLVRQAFTAAPTCSPSRAALLTGQAAHTSGMLGLAHRGFSLNDYHQHLVHILRPAGYVSTLIGMQHVAKDPATIGYDTVLPLPDAHATTVSRAAAEFLRQTPAEPFFLDVGLVETHRPFPLPDPADDPRYCRPPVPIADTPATRADMAGFLTSLRHLDAGAGAVLTALDQARLADRTLVICTTDHGPPFPGMKATLTDQGLGVMLILRGPGGFSGGRVCDALVSQIDLIPTLCDLLAVPAPPWLQGRSLMPVVRGDRAEVNDAVFAEVTYHAAYEPQRAIRTTRWKYIRRFAPQPQPVPANVDDSPSKSLWLANGWPQRLLALEQLYDLLLDPQEGTNLIDSPAHADVLRDLQSRLTAWMQRTGDPLLNGPVPAPPGAELNQQLAISPEEPTFGVQ